MKNGELNRQLQTINFLIGQTHSVAAQGTELQAHWARYICVVVAGFLENAMPLLYGEYSRRCSHPNVSNYVSNSLAKIQNPKSFRFIEVAKSFNPNWERTLEDFLNQEGRLEAINSVMTNRHQIAHGKTSNITIVRIKEYLNKSVEVLEHIEEQLSL